MAIRFQKLSIDFKVTSPMGRIVSTERLVVPVFFVGVVSKFFVIERKLRRRDLANALFSDELFVAGKYQFQDLLDARKHIIIMYALHILCFFLKV